MIGAIIGDIVGSVYEFHNYRGKDFQPFFRKDVFLTDDTVCTIAIADAVLNDIHPARALKDWGGEYWKNGGWGHRFGQWLRSSSMEPYNSFGNGAAMRVSPAGFIATSYEQASQLAKKVTEVTHNHPEGIRGACATATSIFLARSGVSISVIRADLESTWEYDLSKSVDEIRATYQYSERCEDTVPQALTCALEATDYEDAIRNAISIGGDSDTIAAIAGGLAEALFGIPDAIVCEAWSYIPDDMRQVIQTLYRHDNSQQPNVLTSLPIASSGVGAVVPVRARVLFQMEGHIPYVAVMANWEHGTDKKYHLNFFLADPDNLPVFPYEPEMGETFDQLTCSPDVAPASNEEQANDPNKFSTSLNLSHDEILPWTWPDGWWKVKWLIEQEFATETGRYHMTGPRPIPIMKLTNNFFQDTIRALNSD
jgi:ADP-ribosylglycohydrolase